ncbi:hypothetical protein [Streptomyces nigrescens]|uniref:hypothetical protein n=1 Tax=Streptomyces nigrescens TaxID=1920 RepID=UPI00348B1363
MATPDTNLKDEFYAQIRAQGHVLDSEGKLWEELRKTRESLAELVEEKQRQQAETDVLGCGECPDRRERPASRAERSPGWDRCRTGFTSREPRASSVTT